MRPPSAVQRKTSRARRVTCADCFFGNKGLCALGLDEPCPTFRMDTGNGLMPPSQPALLPLDEGIPLTAGIPLAA